MSVPDIDNEELCDLGCAVRLAAYVRKNFAVVNVVYEKFDEEVHTISPAVSVSALFGGIGGNLGLFVGKLILFSQRTFFMTARDGECVEDLIMVWNAWQAHLS